MGHGRHHVWLSEWFGTPSQLADAQIPKLKEEMSFYVLWSSKS